MMQPQAPQGMPQQPMQAPQQPAAQARPNIEVDEFRHILKMLDENALKATANNPKYMQDSLYGPLVHAEVTNRVSIRQQEQMRQQQQAQQAQQQQQAQMQGQQGQMPPQQGQQGQMPPGQQPPQGPAPTEVDKVAQAANTYLAGGGYINTTLPEHSGIAPLAGDMDYADGGIVALAGGGLGDDDLMDLGADDEYANAGYGNESINLNADDGFANAGYDDDILVGGTTREKPKPLGPEVLNPLISEAAKKHGISENVLRKIITNESGGVPNLTNPYSNQVGGLGGVIPSTWERYAKGKDVTDPAANIDVTANIIADNTKFLKNTLGVDPNDSQVYAAHWFGPGVANAMKGGDMALPMDRALELMSNKYRVSEKEDPAKVRKAIDRLASLEDSEIKKMFNDPAYMRDPIYGPLLNKKKVFLQNPNIKPNDPFSRVFEITDAKMGGGKATVASTQSSKPAAKEDDDLYFGKRIPKPESLKDVEIPSDTAGLDKLFDKIETDRKIAAKERASMGARQVKQNPERAKELDDQLKRLDTEKQYLMGAWQDALKSKQPEIFKPITAPLGTFSNAPIPNQPTGLGELGINTDMPPPVSVSPADAAAEDAFFGATYGMGVGAKRGDNTAPVDKKALLDAAKETVPASKRKGMSDEALMMFFLNLMGGRSRNFLRNVSGAGIAALAEERALRKEEAADRKEKALAKYYEQIGDAASKDPELLRTVKGLGTYTDKEGNQVTDLGLGIRRYQQMYAGRSSANSPFRMRMEVEKQIGAALMKNPKYQFDTAAFTAERDRLVEAKMQDLERSGVLGGSGETGGTTFLGYQNG